MIRLALALWAAFALPAFAQNLEPSEDLARALFLEHKALSEAMKASDPDGVRAFFTDGLKARTSTTEWAEFVRSQDERFGARGDHFVHGLTWYDRETLVAAIDFSQPLDNGRGAICGYVVWEIRAMDDMAVARIEQNLVTPALRGRGTTEEVAQLMTDWRCPPPMIEAFLGISKQN